MKRALLGLLLVAFGTSARDRGPQKFAAPTYSAESIVNWATGSQGPFAPNMIATIYGTDLSWSTVALAPEHIVANRLPLKLGGVTVTVGLSLLPLFYVSPTQINFLIPASVVADSIQLRLEREGTAGPAVTLRLDEVAPALCPQPDGQSALAAVDGKLLTAENPAKPNDVVVLYASGLGLPNGRVLDGELASAGMGLTPIILKRLKDLRVFLAGEPVDASAILYAGLAPGFAGVYQINLRLPEQFPADPEIRIAIGDRLGPAGLKLRAK